MIRVHSTKGETLFSLQLEGGKNIRIHLSFLALDKRTVKNNDDEADKDRYNEHRSMRCMEEGENIDNIDFI